MPGKKTSTPTDKGAPTRRIEADKLLQGISRAFSDVRKQAAPLFLRHGNHPVGLFASKVVEAHRFENPATIPDYPGSLWAAPLADGWQGLFLEFQPEAWIAVWIGRETFPLGLLPNRETLRNVSSLNLWRLYLSEEERTVVERPRNGAFMVVGAAGTGKTVVAVHRVRHLVTSSDWKPKDKVLLVTFSITLAEDLRQLVARMLPKYLMETAVEVCALEDWLAGFLKSKGQPHEFLYPGDPRWERAWEEAKQKIPADLGLKTQLPEGFYRSEFLQLVLPEGVKTEKGYLEIDRTGRSVALKSDQRRAIWPVFKAMREGLGRYGEGAIPSSDGYLLATRLLTTGKVRRRYRAIVVDEGQDFGNDAYRLLRALTPDLTLPKLGRHSHKTAPQGDIFITSDMSQRIYSRGQDLARCGINVRSKRTYRLTTNYRTTAEIRSSALVVQEASKSKLLVSRTKRVLYRDEECISLRDGPLPELYQARSLEEEAGWIAGKIKALTAKNPLLALSDIVVATFSRAQRDLYRDALERSGIPTLTLAPEAQAYDGGVCLSTLHRLKGLEFKVVFIAGADRDRMPSASAIRSGCCKEEQEALKKMQQNLFYVASTRARDLLFVTCEREPGEYMAQLSDYLEIFKDKGKRRG